MSLTSELETTAYTLNCGLLASKTSAMLSAPSGTSLTSEDIQVLRSAGKCISDLLHGAETLTSGRPTAGVTAEAITSLGFALNPLERVCGKGPITEEGLIKGLTQMGQLLNDVIAKGVMPEQTNELVMTRDFFAFVADSLLSVLNRPRTPIERPFHA